MLIALGGVSAVVIFALTNHPHRAALALAATLGTMAVARLVAPGRLWFASRSRWLDAVFYAALALLIWYFSPYTATMGLS